MTNRIWGFQEMEKCLLLKGQREKEGLEDLLEIHF